MAKKKSAKHKSFKLSPHGYSQEKIVIYLVVAVVVGVMLGWFLKDNFIAALGVTPY